MTRRCFLHVGCPKTGTTYLQNILWNSPEGLRMQGFRMALHRPRDHFFLTLALRGRLDRTLDPPAALEVMRRFERDLGAPGDEDVVVSHELLAAAPDAAVVGFLDRLREFEVHVVLTARDLARQVPAEWQQQVKTRAVTPYDEFVAAVVAREATHFWKVQDLPAVAARWGRELPPEHVHIVTVPPAGAPPGTLLARFCAGLGLDPAHLKADQPAANHSMGYEQAELLRRVNLALGDRLPRPRAGYNKVVKQDFAESLLVRQVPVQRLALPPERWEWCREASRDAVSRIERGGYDVIGSLADLVPESPPEKELSAPAEADVLAAAVEALAAGLDREHERRAEPQGPVAAGMPPQPLAPAGLVDRMRPPVRRLVRGLRG